MNCSSSEKVFQIKMFCYSNASHPSAALPIGCPHKFVYFLVCSIWHVRLFVPFLAFAVSALKSKGKTLNFQGNVAPDMWADERLQPCSSFCGLPRDPCCSFRVVRWTSNPHRLTELFPRFSLKSFINEFEVLLLRGFYGIKFEEEA